MRYKTFVEDHEKSTYPFSGVQLKEFFFAVLNFLTNNFDF